MVEGFSKQTYKTNNMFRMEFFIGVWEKYKAGGLAWCADFPHSLHRVFVALAKPFLQGTAMEPGAESNVTCAAQLK